MRLSGYLGNVKSTLHVFLFLFFSNDYYYGKTPSAPSDAISFQVNFLDKFTFSDNGSAQPVQMGHKSL